MLPRRACRDHRGHHPWRFIGLYFPEWRVVFTDDLPEDELGLTDHEQMTVFIAKGQNQADRRCTLAHETGHLMRPPYLQRHHLREELIVKRQAARLLLPSVRLIGHAMAWHRADYRDSAEELWVDEDTLNVRISSLTARERARLDEQLATILV